MPYPRYGQDRRNERREDNNVSIDPNNEKSCTSLQYFKIAQDFHCNAFVSIPKHLNIIKKVLQ